ncbi:alpha/beta hydrolase fold domain-containing protein [Treponema sp. OMZ 788]|uniref:alpha/beta hydrolase fold domain-containing protein n=1 Tax=Treponema sp. OMZ 788 TaxID=2563664 RepID=UPI0020A50B7B|nr:alpha/beta hydrolase [Treponema sp. OMZ 788]UTC65037.1 alpha/beta hydrolase fold domain-containing protein [Treponema sp. OMZ 788]
MQNELKDLRELKKKFKRAVLSRKHTIDELRLAYDDILYSPHVPNNVDLSEVELRGVDTDVLKPEMAVSGRVILYAHGGSFISGTKKAYRSFCAGLAHEASADLYLPEYKLAPEQPFPAALEDFYKVYAKLIESHTVAPSNLILAGDGAGGGLILSLIHYLKNKHLPLPALLVLLSPWADLTCSSGGLSANRKKDFVFSQEALLGAAQLYTEEKNLTNELVSPIFGSFENFPPVFIQCGSNEILLDDSIRLCEKIEKAGGRSALDIMENMPHLFQAVPDYFAEAHLEVEAVGKKVNSFFESGSLIENQANLIGE